MFDDHPEPFFITSSGSRYYHETSHYGPSVIYSDGHSVWSIDGVEPCEFNEYCMRRNISEEDIIMLKLKYGA